MSVRPRPVVYHRPRDRRRAPVVAVGLVGLGVLVGAQVAAPGLLAGRDDAGGDARDGAVATGPTTPATAVEELVPTSAASAGPAAVPPSPAAPVARDDGPDLRPVPTTTVSFAAGAVLDEADLSDLGPVLAVLTAPDAAPVLLTGTAEPGPDEASALLLAQRRAEAVAAVLVEAGAPASLLRTTGVVGPDAGRSVVVAAEVP